MHTRHKIVAAAAAAVAGAVTAGAVTAEATPATGVHTIRFVAHQTAAHHTKSTGLATETDRRHGKVVGYDILRIHSTQTRALITGAVALQRGLIYFRIPVNSNGPVYTGTVAGGADTFRGIKGTITARNRNQAGTVTAVTIKYHH